MSEPFSISRRLESFRFAARGVVTMIEGEHNARIHAAVSIAVCAAGFWLGLDRMEWCWIVLAVMAVWTTEGLNSALESLANAVSTDPHPSLRRAKDMAAGAVLIAAVGAAAIGTLILGPHLLARF